jgi:hypothetical protein
LKREEQDQQAGGQHTLNFYFLAIWDWAFTPV